MAKLHIRKITEQMFFLLCNKNGSCLAHEYEMKCTEFVLLIRSTFPISSLQVDRDHLPQGKLVIGLEIETTWRKIFAGFCFLQAGTPGGENG